MVNISYKNLKIFSKNILLKIGATNFIASSLSNGLCDASLRGVDSHGIRLLSHYVNSALNGKKNLKPRFKLSKQFPAVSLLDANSTFGISAGYKAIDYALKDVKKYGISMVVVKNSTHPGALASICLRAAIKGYGVLGFTNADALMLTHNGTKPLLGTNPICFACPFENNTPFCLDMATTGFTWNKLLSYRDNNKKLPKGVAADKNGNVTDDTNNAYSLLPIGGYKGFGLSIMVEILTAVLANMPLDFEIPPMFSKSKIQRKITQTYIVFKINNGGSKANFKNNLIKLSKKVRLQKNNKKNSLMPNDIENNFAKERTKKGIPLSSQTYSDLTKLSKKYSVKLKLLNE